MIHWREVSVKPLLGFTFFPLTEMVRAKIARPSNRSMITNQTRGDIMIASKKPGFKIEGVMKKHGFGMATLCKIPKEDPKAQSSGDDAKCQRGVTGQHAEIKYFSIKLIKWIIVRTEKSEIMLDKIPSKDICNCR